MPSDPGVNTSSCESASVRRFEGPCMAEIYTVSMRLSVKPRFPKRCVVCHQTHPDTKVGVGDFIHSWFSFLTDIPDGWGEVLAPIHNRCKWRFRLRRWLTRLGYCSLVGILYWKFGDWFETQLPRPLQRMGMKVVFAIMLLPVALVESWFWPQRFDVTFFDDTVDFDFSDPSYAMEFREKNKEHLR